MKQPIYAVVDIETTGTNHKNDRIIQFGCVLVEKGKIVSRFATDINPGIKISKQIENLTGISNKQVANAPYFEDVAYTIHQLLDGCIFVAHNIYFDYQFVNSELIRCGVTPLSIPGVDTVELAQIFLPTSSSFRLSDLAEQLNITHERPHQADSDAEVTAHLLILIENKIKSMPLITVEKIVKLADVCGMDTKDFIERCLREMKENISPLDKSIQIIEGIALKKKKVNVFQHPMERNAHYPKLKSQKENLFGTVFTYRKSQVKMMDEVYTFFTDENLKEKKNLGIEAAVGAGKSMGYLFPLSYLITPEKPLIVSTMSILLQSQLVEKDIPLLNTILPYPIQGVLLKSPTHFLHLQKFATTLRFPVKQKQYALYQMGILVWLLETETGDIDELHITSYNHIFWRHVRHQGRNDLSKTSPYYEEDFWNFLLNKMKQANVIVVNHAFLCEESNRLEKLLPHSDYLVVDEAHHFPEVAQKIASQKIGQHNIYQLLSLLNFEEEMDSKLYQIITSEKEWTRYYRSLNTIFSEIRMIVDDIQEEIFYLTKNFEKEPEILLEQQQFEELSMEEKKKIQRFSILLKDACSIILKFKSSFDKMMDKWTVKEQQIMTEWLDSLKEIENLESFFRVFFFEHNDKYIKWLSSANKKHELIYHMTDLSAPDLETKEWFQMFQKVLFTSGTMRVGKDTTYIARELNLSDFQFTSLPSPYSYENQARLYLPQANFTKEEIFSPKYEQYVADVIEKLVRQEDHSALVLFTSRDLLQKVYEKVHYNLLIQGREVLAQGISGTKEKIMKRFLHSNNNILFGTDSFWEGIDLPGDTLKIIIITKLPFVPPNRPFVKAKYTFLENSGINAFDQYALPKAILRLRQGVGRLIRSETDEGVLIILDPRITQAKYGKKMLRSLPKDLPIVQTSTEEMLREIHTFLNND